jgi:hypothetical protein
MAADRRSEHRVRPVWLGLDVDPAGGVTDRDGIEIDVIEIDVIEREALESAAIESMSWSAHLVPPEERGVGDIGADEEPWGPGRADVCPCRWGLLGWRAWW